MVECITHGYTKFKKKVDFIYFGYTVSGMSAKPSPRKQYGRSGAGKTQTTISLSDEALAKAKKNADADGRSLSNYLEQLLKSLPLLALAGLLAYHIGRGPKAWTAAELTATARAAWSKVAKLAR